MNNQIKLAVVFLALTFNSFVIIGQINNGIQASPCQDKFGTFPSSFEGQKCWLLYAFKDSIYIYGDKTNIDINKLIVEGLKYHPLKIKEEDVNQYLNYNVGLNNFYLPENYTAWGGNWYACRDGGIAHRFHGDIKDYPISSKLNWGYVKKLSKDELFKLSPAEKLDIYLNDSTFSISKFELQNRGPERANRDDDGWCGFCNGARIAGVIMPEPKKNVTLWSIGENSQEVTFSVGDIKAIISASYMHPAFTFSFGLPDEQAGDNNPNPGIFDLFLRLYLGKNKIPFVVDDAFGKAIFNETILGYNRKLSKRRELSNNEKQIYKTAKKAIEVGLTLYLQDELSFESSEQKTISIMSDSTKALNKFEAAAVHKNWVHRKNYTYTLFVDNSDIIIDGQWIGEPVDFAWAAHGNGNEDFNVPINDTPGIPKSDRNKKMKWSQVKYILTKSLEP